MSTVSAYAKARRGQTAEGTVFGETQQLTAAANAGILVTRLNAAEGKVKAPSTAAEAAALDGALAYDASYPRRTDTQATDYAAGDMVPIADNGPIYLYAETAMTRGAQPYVRYAAGAGGTELGVLRSGAVASETALCANIVILETTTAAGPVKVRLNLPA